MNPVRPEAFEGPEALEGRTSPLLLDTHALVWLVEGDPALGVQTRALADEAVKADALLVSAVSFWEVAMLAQRGRLGLASPVSRWRLDVLALGIQEVPLSGSAGILATELEGLPPDPADRMIVATAMEAGATLVTADTAILTWPADFARHNARR